jgi:hypothetical protein
METLEEIKEVLIATARQTAEMARQTAETARQTTENARLSAQNARRFDEEIRALNRKLGEMSNWLGEFAEYQILPAATRLFREQNLPLHEVYVRLRQEDEEGYGIYEVDILVANSNVAVALEVKNTLRQRDVEDHLERLEKMKRYPLKVIRDTDLYGAVAGMVVKKEVEDFATKKGLFVIKPSGDSAEISNAGVVKPKVWHTNA